MTDTAFDIAYCKSLNSSDQKAYITKFFVPLRNGEHAVLYNGKYDIVDQATIKKTYFNRLHDDLSKFYFHEYSALRIIVSEINEEVLFDDKLNICPKIKAIYKPYKDFDTKTKNGVEIFLKYIKEILADNNEDSYVYLVNWLSYALKGNRNEAAIYLKGAQGIGKSTISDFTKEHVVGTELFLESGSAPLKNTFNGALDGKLFVQFSELENVSSSEWQAMSSTLKRQITSTTINIEKKYKDAAQVKNYNNYIIDSNNDAIKDDEGRRYFIADVSHKHKGDRDYFGNIRKNCFNDDVGSAFYSYMLEYDSTGFNAQEYPMTTSKLNSFVKRLDSAFAFIKDEYILQEQGFNIKPYDMFNFYTFYCRAQCVRYPHNKTAFCEKIEKQFENIRVKSGTFYYRKTFDELKAVADKEHWLHEYDEIAPTNEEEMESARIHDEIERHKQEIERLKQILIVRHRKENPVVETVPGPQVVVPPPLEEFEVVGVVPNIPNPQKKRKVVVKKKTAPVETEEEFRDLIDELF